MRYLNSLIILIIQAQAPFPKKAHNYFINQVARIIQATCDGTYDRDDPFLEDPGNLEITTRELIGSLEEPDDKLEISLLKEELAELFDNKLPENEIDNIWNLFYEDTRKLPRTIKDKEDDKEKKRVEYEQNRIKNKLERETRIRECLNQKKRTTNYEELSKLDDQINKIRIEGKKKLQILETKKEELIKKRDNRILINAISIRINQIKQQMQAEEETEKRLKK